ncbi:hypothetical protein WOLCODRAFT_150626 [Wolfiporia cocos MD-104 SS10]|uniref:Uncharacterized protein n=1 Tax=Wolfiporia cocos (strain MD-104) TaxID=742152 RepID=A0A2H3JED5_WOLCO|nr:hypothetical protein WOLCODRAFT_150626 [Wolfiporia cocos MD-104 SS10]
MFFALRSGSPEQQQPRARAGDETTPDVPPARCVFGFSISARVLPSSTDSLR